MRRSNPPLFLWRFVAGSHEAIAADRKKFSEQLRAYYDRLHIPYKVVNGKNYAVRLTQAKDFINEAFF